MRKILIFFLLVSGFWFLVSSSLYAEEEIGLIRKVWRSLFKKPPAPNSAKKEELSTNETAAETPQEYENKRFLSRELQRQKEERDILEGIKRAQEAQRTKVRQP